MTIRVADDGAVSRLAADGRVTSIAERSNWLVSHESGKARSIRATVG